MTSNSQNDKKGTHIPIWLLITVIITLIVGLIAGYVFNNMLVEKQLTFTTASLVSFVFTVALGGASIILAIMTIVLTRQAEDALIRRSDEGIKLQTDVFVRTNEVLSKIQSSTGVTEKRIEDIISGRTAVIASEVIDKSMPKGAHRLTDEMIDEIKKDLAESLKTELLPLLRPTPSRIEDHLEQLEATQKRRKEISDNWTSFRTAIVAEARKHPEMQVLSESQGTYIAESPETFWDMILTVGDKRYAVDVHTKEQFFDEAGSYFFFQADKSVRVDYARRVSWRLLEDDIHVLVFAWDNDVSNEPSIQEFVSMLRRASAKVDIRLVHGTAPAIVGSLMS
jgi:hypothetical protein